MSEIFGQGGQGVGKDYFLPAFPLCPSLQHSLGNRPGTEFSLRLAKLKGVAPFYHSITKHSVSYHYCLLI